MSLIEANRAHVGEAAAVEPTGADLLITIAVAERPGAIWTADQIVRATGLSIVDVLVGVARLVASGHIERVSPARYRHPTRPADKLAGRIRRDVLGLRE
ncbi:hypothetical protein HC251_00520 [Iamia sp. SCSIO 61187]|uniref:hypothetical protein n=1 Tax=Iamia sp. SCSIO 61187 TaxID=2722752 RepID=UPI001C62A427|nr:hypothetical protein [Iamia sp. SCSIO 61187]QYG91065.1 hypothetical protein HC251_00520 [Iamia sp. SCSIO 61187]